MDGIRVREAWRRKTVGAMPLLILTERREPAWSDKR